MKGIVKSAPLSRSDVIVKSVIAKSAFCLEKKRTFYTNVDQCLKCQTPSRIARIMPFHSLVTLLKFP